MHFIHQVFFCLYANVTDWEHCIKKDAKGTSRLHEKEWSVGNVHYPPG